MAWNMNVLDQTVVDAGSVEVFKKQLHKEGTRWTYSWTDILKVLGRIREYFPDTAV